MNRLVLRIIKRARYYIWIRRIRRTNGVRIYSRDASTKAQYGYKTAIGKGTVISDDVLVGDYSYVNVDSRIENASIGRFCSISSGVRINPGEHELNRMTTYPIDKLFGEKTPNINKRVEIGNDVLICANAIILSGVKIGNGAVIGAGAVITHDIPPYAIVGGVPGKILRYRFSQSRIKEIQDLEWWNWTEETICENKKMFLENLAE